MTASHSDDDFTDKALTVVDELMDALVALESEQDEGSDAMQLTQLVAVDVRDILDVLESDQQVEDYSAGGELSATARWLAAYRSDHPDLVTKLTELVDHAAGSLFHDEASAENEEDEE